MKSHPHILRAIRRELSDWQLWLTRALALTFAVFSGLTVVAFTEMSEWALRHFFEIERKIWWMPLLWTPVCAAAIVWITRRFAPGAAGSGIPQVMAALTPGLPHEERSMFVSLRLTIMKMLLTSWGLLAGLSLGREGPSVQVAAGVMHSARRWLPVNSSVSEHGLLIAGGAAGIAAAFNTPLGGVIFAIEELSRNPEQRSNGLLMAAIILAGLMAVSIYGNATYFGVIHVESVPSSLIIPGSVVAIACGAAGGLFARLLALSLSGRSADWFSRARSNYPVRFAAGCGLAVALIGVSCNGATFGGGYEQTRMLLEGQANTSSLYALLKFMSTWITASSGVPAGIFAPALAIGGAIGDDIAQWQSIVNSQALIALGMAGFLAAVTQAPMTAFIIVMEMVDGHALVLSLMACALISSGLSRLVSAPLYTSLAELQLARLQRDSLETKSLPSNTQE